jgi:hypothetical protein
VIRGGETTLLTWNVRNVTEIQLEVALESDANPADRLLHSVGAFPAIGSLKVSPKATATYVLSCGPESESGFGCVSASVTVLVK